MPDWRRIFGPVTDRGGLCFGAPETLPTLYATIVGGTHAVFYEL